MTLRKFKQRVGVVATYKVIYFYSRLACIFLFLFAVVVGFYLIAEYRNNELTELGVEYNFFGHDFKVIRVLMLLASVIELPIVLNIRYRQTLMEEKLARI